MPRQTIQIRSFTLCDAEPGSDVDDVRARPESDWLPAAVPGGVHEALLAAGRIADPYFDRNEDSRALGRGARLVVPRAGPRRPVQHSVAAPSWSVTDWTQSPIFGSTDQPLGHSENMFRPATFRRNRSPGGSGGVADLLPPAPCWAYSTGVCNQLAAAPRRYVRCNRARGAGRRRGAGYVADACRWRPCGVRPPSPGAGTSDRGCPRLDRGGRSRWCRSRVLCLSGHHVRTDGVDVAQPDR